MVFHNHPGGREPRPQIQIPWSLNYISEQVMYIVLDMFVVGGVGGRWREEDISGLSYWSSPSLSYIRFLQLFRLHFSVRNTSILYILTSLHYV